MSIISLKGRKTLTFPVLTPGRSFSQGLIKNTVKCYTFRL